MDDGDQSAEPGKKQYDRQKWLSRRD
jgi:hypothetical protein